MRWVVALVLAAVLAAASAPAFAMKFKLGTTGAGVRVVVASGDIVRGDARRLSRALERADRDRHGTKLLYIDGPGGMVLEALKMAEIMRAVGVSTIVRKSTVCASACASILFVSGKYRTVEKGGVLAIHSCFDARNGRAASHCNAIISAHAESAGVSGLAMMALQEAAGNDAAIVFDTDDAACFGFSRKPGARASKKAPPCIAEAARR
jgi:hypothetical protein